MTDIVERLQDYKLNEEPFAIPLRHEAATEIETLRTDLANEREAHALVIKECNRLKKLGQEFAAQVRSEMI